jgi:hypothetical protein
MRRVPNAAIAVCMRRFAFDTEDLPPATATSAALARRRGMELATVGQVSWRTRADKNRNQIEMMFYRLGVVATFLALIVVTAFVLARTQWPQLDD